MTTAIAQPNSVREKLVVTAAVLATGLIYLDQTAVSVALPNIQTDLQANITDIQWIININLLALSPLLLIGGVLGDILGRGKVYRVGMGILAVTSVGCALAPNLGLLIAARFLQGIGGALMVPAGLALINGNVAPSRRNRLLANWAMFSSAVLTVGPSVAGWLVDLYSWRAVFWLNVPISLFAVFLVWRFVPDTQDPSTDTIDVPGLITLLIGMSGLIYGLIEGRNQGWRSPLIVSAFVVGGLMFVLFIRIEQRVNSPLIRLSLFRRPTFSGVTAATLIFFVAMGTTFFFFPLLLQQAFGYTAFGSGLALIPRIVPLLLLSQLVGRLADRFGPRRVLLIGQIITAVSFVYFARIRLDSSYWGFFFPALLVSGVGLSMVVVPLTTIALAALPQRYSGLASGINNAASRIASMLALAILGSRLVVTFSNRLAQNTAEIPLTIIQRTMLLTASDNLGATTPPAGLNLAVQTQIQHLIRASFVDSFQEMMLIAAVLITVSLALTVWLVDDRELE